MKNFFLSFAGLVVASAVSAQTSYSTNAGQLIKKMTLEEKVKLVVGMGMNIPGLTTGAPVVGQTLDKVP
ncbi:MAG: hypothetical protein ABIS01_02455, partial [Ferruginibacter sp.]